jgi:hypothetical protein
MKKQLFEKIIFFITILLNIFFLLLVFGQFDEHETNIYIWSDTLYLPSIFKDLFVDGTGFGTWNLNGAPNFFPDMPLYFIINAFTDNFIIALFTFSLIQYLYLMLFSYLFIKAFFSKIPLYSISLGFLLMLLFFYITTIKNNFVVTFYIVSVSFHLSAYILTLVCAWQAALYFKSGKNKNLIIYALVAFLAALSDKLFLVIFSIPSLLWLILLTKKTYRKTIVIFISVSVVTVVLSITTYNLINLSKAVSFITTSGKTFQFGNTIDSYRVMFDQHWHYIKNLDTRGLTDVLALISFIISVILLISKRKILFSRSEISSSEFLELCYLLFFVGSVFLTFNAPAINGYYVGWAILRFNIYAIYLAILNFSFLSYVLIRYRNEAKRIILVPAVVLLICFALVHGILYGIKIKPVKGLSNFFSYCPEWVNDIDSACVANNLNYGISDYVFAKHFTMFSKQNKRIYSVHSNLRPWHHVTNEDWFYGGKKGKYSKPEFSFVILEKLDTNIVREKFTGHILDTIELKKHNLHLLITDPFIFERETKNIIYLPDSVVVVKP